MRFKKLRTALIVFLCVSALATIRVESHENPVVRAEDETRNHLLQKVFPAIYTIKAVTELKRAGSSPDETMISATAATGFVVTEDGLVLTNKHVVQSPVGDNPEPILDGVNTWRYQDGSIATVSFRLVGNDGATHTATILAVHPKEDLALLVIDNAAAKKPFTALVFEDGPILWDKVISIGAPFELSFTVGEGVISNPSFILENSVFIQTTALVHPGSSGGPLILLKNHKVAGVTSMFYNPFGKFGIGIGLAIPASTASEFIRGTLKQLEVKKSQYHFRPRAIRR